MVTEELLQFIRAQERRGKSREEITAMLGKAGWTQEDIAIAFSQIAPATSEISGELPSVGVLLRQTWLYYRAHWLRLTGVLFLSNLMVLGLYVLILVVLIFSNPLSVNPSPTFYIALFAVMPLYLFINAWSTLALLTAIIKDTHVLQSFRTTRFQIFPFLWVSVLFDVISIGTLFFFLIPGIIFSVWSLFFKYIFVSENIHGVQVFYRSREYTRGRWGEVAGKFVVLPVILSSVVGLFVLVSRVLQMFNSLKVLMIVWTILFYLLVFLIVPAFAAVYSFVMYTHVRRPVAHERAGKRTKLLLWGGTICGLIILILYIWLAKSIYNTVLPDGCLSPEPGQCSVQTNNMLSTQQRDEREKAVFQAYLESYHNRYGAYPQNIIAVIPASGTFERQMVTSGGIVYQSLQSGQNYMLCIKNLPDSCITTHHPARAVMPTHFEPQASGEATPK